MVAFCVVMWDDCLMSCMICVLSVVCNGVHCSADRQYNRQSRTYSLALRWRHNERDGVSNHQPHDCLLSRLFWRRSKKSSKFRVTGLCEGNIRGLVKSPHKGLVTRKMFPFDDIIMVYSLLPPGNWPNFTWIKKTETKGTGKQKPGGGKPQRNNRAQRTDHYTTSTTDCKNKCQNKHQRIMPENWKTKLETQKANYRTTKNNWWTQRDNYKTQKYNYWN